MHSFFSCSMRPRAIARTVPVTMLGLSAVLLAGCAGDHGSDAPASTVPAPVTLACDETLKTAFKPDAATSVLLVKAFRKGEPLTLGSGTVAQNASNDVCVVKLLIGPGNPGPADAPSTSRGIGIEVWLPAPGNWNDRIHVKGGGGWAGGPETSITVLAGTAGTGPGSVNAASVAMEEGAVSATTDTGHVAGQSFVEAGAAFADASFAMNPDGTINTTLWKDFAERGIHEMAVKTKALAKAYYGREAKYAYWDGGSTGGRQGLREAQANPADFDGILAGYPAINWTKFITAELYPQIVYQRDLAGVNLTAQQLTAMSNAAIDSCGTVGGVRLGYIPDPAQCTYDPRKDASVLCAGETGVGVTGTGAAGACVNLVQATAMNKIWYGQTADGSVPDPAVDNGFNIRTAPSQKWYGLVRGTMPLALAGAGAMPIASELVALELQDPLLASPGFRNATGNGANGWKNLSYAGLSNAWDRGLVLQPQFANINTDDPNLSAFRDRGGKVLVYHGLADVLIPAQGSINYYHRVADQMGGIDAVQRFFRLYLVPGMAHSFENGTTNPTANPPLPSNVQMYQALTDWVEKGIAPAALTVSAPATATAGAKSRPLCVYPQKAVYTTGDPNQAGSYICS